MSVKEKVTILSFKLYPVQVGLQSHIKASIKKEMMIINFPKRRSSY